MDKRFMILENKLCKELEILEEKYRSGNEMNESDLRRIDLLTHAMKSLAAYTAMQTESPQMYNNSYMNNSYMNGSYMNGSYMNNPNYGNNMRNGDMSGHYPPNYPMYPEERRW